ncbi:cytochrome P450 26A1-like [Saccostrea echinata]|uniref:cytochrome P450 26A1-like n=1 Tax=Saccostrea echinata TaxID=191078 RepID=UPI002A7FE1D9|nr:cytochrome P450 26A1-like [Saccostrea echinata]
MFEFFLILFLCVLLYKYLQQYRGCGTNLPPGRMGIPILGESLQFLHKKAKFFEGKRKEHGNIYKTHLFGRPTIRISGKKNLEKLFAAENKLLQCAYPTSVWKILGKNSLSSSTGQVHAEKKIQLLKCLSPGFFDQNLPVVSDFLTGRIYEWCRKSSIEIFADCHSMFLELASTFLVSMDMPKDERKKIQTLYHDITNNLFTLPLNIPGFGFHKACKAKEELKSLFLKRIKEDGKTCSQQFPTVLEKFCKSQNSEFDNDDLLNGIFELIFNAGETTSTSAMCALVHLSKHPEVLEKLRQELSNIDLLAPPEENNNSEVEVTTEIFNKLPYLDCVYKEILRVTPAVGGAYRKVLQTFELEGYTIPEGWTVVLGIRDTHELDSNLKDPLTFNPDRWLQADSSKISFFPFASGPRRCPGKGYAHLILKLFIIKLCQQCNWTLSEPNPEMVAMPTPRPKNKLMGSFTLREHYKE